MKKILLTVLMSALFCVILASFSLAQDMNLATASGDVVSVSIITDPCDIDYSNSWGVHMNHHGDCDGCMSHSYAWGLPQKNMRGCDDCASTSNSWGISYMKHKTCTSCTSDSSSWGLPKLNAKKSDCGCN